MRRGFQAKHDARHEVGRAVAFCGLPFRYLGADGKRRPVRATGNGRTHVLRRTHYIR